MKKGQKLPPEVDYDTIYTLYKINKLNYTESQNRKRRKDITACFREFLKKRNCTHLTWYDLPEQDKGYFICYEVKEILLKGYENNKTHIDEIEKNLKNYSYKHLITDESSLDEKNKKVDKLNKLYLKKNFSAYQKEQAYEEFLEDWHFMGYFNPPSFKTFVNNPKMTIRDYRMSNLEESYDSDYMEEILIDKIVNETAFRIVENILYKMVGLKIDYALIRESVEHVYAKKYKEGLDSVWGDYGDEKIMVSPEGYYHMIETRDEGLHSTPIDPKQFNSHLDFIEHILSKIADMEDGKSSDNKTTDTKVEKQENEVAKKEDEHTEEEKAKIKEKMKEDYAQLLERTKEWLAHEERLLSLNGLYDVDNDKLEKLRELLKK